MRKVRKVGATFKPGDPVSFRHGRDREKMETVVGVVHKVETSFAGTPVYSVLVYNPLWHPGGGRAAQNWFMNWRVPQRGYGLRKLRTDLNGRGEKPPKTRRSRQISICLTHGNEMIPDIGGKLFCTACSAED